MQSVSLVIPGKNAASTIGVCLNQAARLLEKAEICEIIFVDDQSTDDTERIVRGHPSVTYLRGPGTGPAAARNVGWRFASGKLIWFIDADCVVESSTLRKLQGQLTTAGVAAVGGSYDNLMPGSLLACLIHEEIISRHRAMPAEVNFVATFNVLYRRSVLEELNGFDAGWSNVLRSEGAEDADLAYRVSDAGYTIRFEPASRVGHFHPTSLGRYLRKQYRQAFYRVLMYWVHPRRMAGDSYSGWRDHVQPPLVVLGTLCLPLLAGSSAWFPVMLWLLLLVLQVPMTASIWRRTGAFAHLTFAGLGWLRAIVRGAGMTVGILWIMRSTGTKRPRVKMRALRTKCTEY